MAARLASTALWTRLAERCRFALERNLAGRDSRHVQQVVDQADHVADLTLHHPAHALDRTHGVAAAPNQFEAGSYRRERISQLVRQHRQELVFARIGFPQLLLGAGAFDGLPGPLRGVLDQFDFLWRPGPRRTVAHAQRRDQPAVPDQRRRDERTDADRGDRRTIRVGNQRRGARVGHDHRAARPEAPDQSS